MQEIYACFFLPENLLRLLAISLSVSSLCIHGFATGWLSETIGLARSAWRVAGFPSGGPKLSASVSRRVAAFFDNHVSSHACTSEDAFFTFTHVALRAKLIRRDRQ
jgi:hypothetical protein